MSITTSCLVAWHRRLLCVTFFGRSGVCFPLWSPHSLAVRQPLFMRSTNVDVVLWPLLITVLLLFIDTEILSTKTRPNVSSNKFLTRPSILSKIPCLITVTKNWVISANFVAIPFWLRPSWVQSKHWQVMSPSVALFWTGVALFPLDTEEQDSEIVTLQVSDQVHCCWAFPLQDVGLGVQL